MLALGPLICALSESASAFARFSDRVTSSYSLSSWSMVPSSVAIWEGYCASRTWSVKARTIGASTRSMMPRSDDSEA